MGAESSDGRSGEGVRPGEGEESWSESKAGRGSGEGVGGSKRTGVIEGMLGRGFLLLWREAGEVFKRGRVGRERSISFCRKN